MQTHFCLSSNLPRPYLICNPKLVGDFQFLSGPRRSGWLSTRISITYASRRFK